ncbi:hypothetical protein CUO_0484 [Enterococcus faecium PC4.1]|nr:hypothetical protein CUO_0484 [Enterococcus faecium PC4.1]
MILIFVPLDDISCSLMEKINENQINKHTRSESYGKLFFLVL